MTEQTHQPEAFERVIRVEATDIDELGHVNNAVYLRWVQEAAAAHWRVLASALEQAELVWVVLRHEIDYQRPALAGEEILVRTWVGAAVGLRFERHTEVLRHKDRQLLARARTIWCPVDPSTHRPRRVSQEVRARFSGEGRG